MVSGSGQPILLLHGLGMSLAWWQPALAALSGEYVLCAIDLPGAGESTGSIEPTREACRDLVAGVIRALDLGPAIVVGHSLGGFVAANAAILGAPGMKALMLVAPGGFGQIKHPLLRLLSFPVLGELMIHSGNLGSQAFLRSVVFNPGALTPDIWKLANANSQKRRDFLRQVHMGMRRGRTTAAYRVETSTPLRLPVQVIWGRHDPVHPVSDMDRAQSMLGAKGGLIFERSGHLPQLEEPTRFYATLRSFAGRL